MVRLLAELPPELRVHVADMCAASTAGQLAQTDRACAALCSTHLAVLWAAHVASAQQCSSPRAAVGIRCKKYLCCFDGNERHGWRPACVACGITRSSAARPDHHILIGIGIGMRGAAALSLTSDVPLATGNGGPRGLCHRKPDGRHTGSASRSWEMGGTVKLTREYILSRIYLVGGV